VRKDYIRKEHVLESGTMKEEGVIFCSVRPYRMERFLKGCLVFLLYDEIGYGYGLIIQLAYFGFPEVDLN